MLKTPKQLDYEKGKKEQEYTEDQQVILQLLKNYTNGLSKYLTTYEKDFKGVMKKELDDRLNKATADLKSKIGSLPNMAKKIFEEASNAKLATLLKKGDQEAIMEIVKAFLSEEDTKFQYRIVIPDVAEIPMEGKHYSFPNVVETLSYFRKAYLWGPTGTGKSYMCRQFADEMGLNYAEIAGNSEMSKFELIGFERQGGDYARTSFLDMYENGGVFVIDEVDAVPPEVSIFINTIADFRESIFISSLGEIKKHKDFYLILCANTRGQSDFNYAARSDQDKALMDRFRMQTIYIDYDSSLEKIICGERYETMMELRKVREGKGSYLSTRNIADILIYLKGGKSMNAVMKMFENEDKDI